MSKVPTTEEISGHFQNIDEASISRETISQSTSRVVEEMRR